MDFTFGVLTWSLSTFLSLTLFTLGTCSQLEKVSWASRERLLTLPPPSPTIQPPAAAPPHPPAATTPSPSRVAAGPKRHCAGQQPDAFCVRIVTSAFLRGLLDSGNQACKSVRNLAILVCREVNCVLPAAWLRHVAEGCRIHHPDILQFLSEDIGPDRLLHRDQIRCDT